MTSPWWRICVSCPAEDADLVAGWLVAQTGQGVAQPAPQEVVAIVASRAEARRIAAAVTARFGDVSTAISAVAAVDWSVHWRDGIVSRSFGRLTVAPSWLTPASPAGVVVTIDPGAAFGSGEHGSTRGALALIERWLVADTVMLDFGSGSGILSIAAVALGARRAVGIDLDPDAQEVAAANAALNGVADRCSFLTGDAEVLGPLAGPGTLVCSNILREPNIELLPAVRRALTPGGVAVFAGMEESEAPLFLPALGTHRFEPFDEVCDAGWWSVAARPR